MSTFCFHGGLSGRGSGKSGGSVRAAKEAKDSLQSVAIARVVDLLCDGPIEGFCTATGVTVKDVLLYWQPTDNTLSSSGVFQVPANTFYEWDSKLYALRSPDGVAQPLFSPEGAGYPFVVEGIPLINLTKFKEDADETEKEEADWRMHVLPRTVTEQNLTSKVIAAVLPDEAGLGSWVVWRNAAWQVIGEPTLLAPCYKVTHKTGSSFTGVLQINPLGCPYALELVTGGKGYELPIQLECPAASAQSIYLDNVPLADPLTLRYNFTDFKYSYTRGEEHQPALEDFEQVEVLLTAPGEAPSEITFAQTAPPALGGNDVPVTRIITQPFDALLVTFMLPQGLYRQNVENGDIEPITLKSGLAPEISVIQRIVTLEAGTEHFGPWRQFGPKPIYRFEGKTMSAYSYTVEGSLLRPANAQVQYRHELQFRRLTKDDSAAANPAAQHTVVAVEALVGLQNLRLSYPWCALFGLKIRADQFSAIPRRSYRLKLGLVEVPSNYFPPYTLRTRLINGELVQDLRPHAEYCRKATALPDELAGVYDTEGNALEQVWDGTTYTSWTDNPAYICQAVCSNERWGLGDRLSPPNKWMLYEIGRYCDELVPTGFSSGFYNQWEPRFRLNVYLAQATEAWKVLTDLASACASSLFYQAGEILFSQDRPRKARFVFNTTNIGPGGFEYAGIHAAGRHSAAVIQYMDATRRFQLQPTLVQDETALQRFGWRPIERTAFGCTSAGQARRLGRRLLLSESNLTSVVRFETGLLGAALRPGDIIEIYDPVRSSVPFGGRIADLRVTEENNTLVELDRLVPPDLLQPSPGLFSTYGFVCQCPVAAPTPSEVTSLEELKQLAQQQLAGPFNILGFAVSKRGKTTLTVKGLLPAQVKVTYLWGLRRLDVQPQYARVLRVEEKSRHKFSVEALEYQEALYEAIDREAAYSEPPINPDLTAWQLPHPPRNLRVVPIATLVDGVRAFTVEVSWTPPAEGFALQYEVQWRRAMGNWQQLTVTRATNVAMQVMEADSYSFRVRTIGLTGARSTWATLATVIGDLVGENAELVSGLELRGAANETEFHTAEAVFDWRVNWSAAPSTLQTAVPPVLPPAVANYEVRLYDADMRLLWSGTTASSDYTLTLDANRALVEGPYRDFIIGVQVRLGDGSLSAETKLRVHNERPPVPTWSVEAVPGQEQTFLVLAAPALPDFSHFNLWMAETAGFEPTLENLTFSGNANRIALMLEPGKVYYCRVAALDLLAVDALDANLSDEFTVEAGPQSVLSALGDVFGPTW